MGRHSSNNRPIFQCRLNPLPAAVFLVSILSAAGCGIVLPPVATTTSPPAAVTSPPVVQETAPPTPLPTDEALACATAAELAVTNPEQALQLIDRIRGSYAPQETAGRTSCTEERNYALQKLGEAQKAALSPTPSPIPEPVQAQKAWDTYVGSWLAPWQTLALTAIGAIFGLLILARLLALLPPPWMPPRRLDWKSRSTTLRRTTFWGGLILIVGPTLQILTNLARSQRTGTSALIIDPWDLFWLMIMALTGSWLFGIWIASRPRLSIVVRDKEGAVQEANTSYIIAVLGELGATPPRGVEVPRGADATGLADASVSAELSNKFLAAVAKAIAAIFGGTPWRISVDAVSESDLAVVITRNGWAVKATTLSTSNHLLFPVTAKETEAQRPVSTQPGQTQLPATTHTEQTSLPLEKVPKQKASESELDEVSGTELYKLAAAFIVATLAEHYQGYEGLCGATDWRSIGLQYLATTGRGLDETARKVVLARSVELDPQNLLAEASLMNLLYRHEVESQQRMQDYENWLKTKCEIIEKMGPEFSKRDQEKKYPRNDLFEGHRGLLYRLRLTQLSVMMNRAAASNQELPCMTPEDYRSVALELIKRLSRSTRSTADLEKRMRPLVGLLYYDLLGLTETTRTNHNGAVWMKWREDALHSPSPTIAYSVACSYARSRNPNDQDIETKLAVAALDDELARWMHKDPELKKYLWEPKGKHEIAAEDDA